MNEQESRDAVVTVSEFLDALAAAKVLAGQDVEAHSLDDETQANLNVGCTVISF